MKVFIVFTFAKSSAAGKTKEYSKKLEEQLNYWKDGNIEVLIKEGQVIQKRLMDNKRTKPDDTARIFAKLMFQGKIIAAFNLLKSRIIFFLMGRWGRSL